VTVGIRKGEPWGEATDAAADVTVTGGDADLASALHGTARGVLVAFDPSPDSDLARAVGLSAGTPRQGLALTMDALELPDGSLAVNAIVLGAPPDRLTALRRSAGIVLRVDGRSEPVSAATTVVVATGQWLRGLDLVPRGHPGDGRAEVQAYRLGRRQRRAMRARLPTGTHLPHPEIVTRSGVVVEVEADSHLPLEVDGHTRPATATLRCTLVPARYRLLI
jgi:hypothetical protein